jgi:hypothetical protein
MKRYSKIFERARSAFSAKIELVNTTFNQLPSSRKKASILVFGLCVTAISAILVIGAVRDHSNHILFRPERIAMPYDIFMKDGTNITETQLTPVGKMKGEIDGEFESFYVAVDNAGGIYINRDIEYSERAYDKTDDWKQISREKLTEYEKDLHFIPSRSRGIGR